MFCSLVSQFSIWTLQYYATMITNKYLGWSFIFHSLLCMLTCSRVCVCVWMGAHTFVFVYKGRRSWP